MPKLAGWIVAVCLAVLAGVAGYGWYAYVGHEIPPAYADIEDGEHTVFAYGTLRHGWLRRIVVGRAVGSREAVLEGYRKSGLDIIEDRDAHVAGERFTVSADELRRLDRYERVGVRYERVLMELADGTGAWVYRRLE